MFSAFVTFTFLWQHRCFAFIEKVFWLSYLQGTFTPQSYSADCSYWHLSAVCSLLSGAVFTRTLSIILRSGSVLTVLFFVDIYLFCLLGFCSAYVAVVEEIAAVKHNLAFVT